ncbi:MAG: hypothetical protein EBU06_02930 [Micrococcales bacterium]|nr:hypothetical protein [Micrococcales bacterium]NBR61753.1 hypothetical protein [Actinomycetota bacterium]NBT47906.1 hypothetical protein [Actinomycetota bacterium]NBY43446.1 hypothetical protein [Micrococcales bacterium]
MKTSKESLAKIRAAGYFFLAISLFLLVAMFVLNVFLGFTNFMQGFDSGNRGHSVSPIPATAANYAIGVLVVSAIMVVYSTISLDRINYRERFQEKLQNEEIARLVDSAITQKAVGLGGLFAIGIPLAMMLVLPMDSTKLSLAPISILLLIGTSAVGFTSLSTTIKKLLALEEDPKNKKSN